MKNNLMYFGVFIAGAALGSALTWKYAKDKFEKIAEDEIDSMRKMFQEYKNKINNKNDNGNISNDQGDDTVKEYEKYSKMYDKTNDNNDGEKEDDVSVGQKPYIISPEEFDEIEDYEKVSLTYYSGDGVLAESISDEVMLDEELEDSVGKDFASHFGEYEDDSVFVRNDKRCIDYEILMDERCYKDIVEQKFSNVANKIYD